MAEFSILPKFDITGNTARGYILGGGDVTEKLKLIDYGDRNKVDQLIAEGVVREDIHKSMIAREMQSRTVETPAGDPALSEDLSGVLQQQRIRGLAGTGSGGGTRTV